MGSVFDVISIIENETGNEMTETPAITTEESNETSDKSTTVTATAENIKDKESMEISNNKNNTGNATTNIDNEMLITTTESLNEIVPNTLILTMEVPVNENDSTKMSNSNSKPMNEVENFMNNQSTEPSIDSTTEPSIDSTTEPSIDSTNLPDEKNEVTEYPTTPTIVTGLLSEIPNVTANKSVEANENELSVTENIITVSPTNESSEISNDLAVESTPLPENLNIQANNSTEMLHNLMNSAKNILEKLNIKNDENIEQKDIGNPFE